jgi:hypothetical protein
MQVWYIFLGIAAVSLVRSTVGQGTDLLVFWKVGRSLIEGIPFYDLAREGGMVFKYPPWIAPMLMPLGFFSFETAKWIWGIFCVACMAGIFAFLERTLQISKKVWIPLAFLYWGIWVVHALDGQIIVPLLFLTLIGYARASLMLPVLLSAKIFTVFPMIFNLKKFVQPRVLAPAILIVFGLTAISAALSFDYDFYSMFTAWGDAAASGSTYLAEGQTRGAKNQSVTSFLCRVFSVPSSSTSIEVGLSVLLFLSAWLFFRRRMQSLSDLEKFMVGLCLAPVFHPLPWHHLYVFTFPLAAYAIQNRGRLSISALTLAIFLITLSSERAFGLVEILRPIGHFLEWNVGRAWGALLLAFVFTRNE